MTEKYSNVGVDRCEEIPSYRDATVAPTPTAIDVLTQIALQKALIAKVMGLSVFASLILCVALPPRYTAVTSIMPPKQTQSTTTFLNSQVGSLADAAGVGLLKDPNAIYIGLLRSRPIADAIISRFDMMRVYRSRDMTAARRKLESNTEIVSEKSTLLSISVTDGNGERSAEIANAYADELRTLSKNISVTEASRRRLFFEEQLKEQREALIAAEVVFQQIQLSKGLVHLDAQANGIIGGLAALRGQIAAKQVELQALRSYSTERNPEVQLAERELSTMQGESAHLDQGTRSAGYSDISLRDLPKAGLDYIRAERELQYQQSVFDLLLRQYEAARLDEAKEAAVIQVVEPAIKPERKSFPNRVLIVPLFLFGGLFAGCLLAMLSWWWDAVQSDPERSMQLQSLISALLARPGALPEKGPASGRA